MSKLNPVVCKSFISDKHIEVLASTHLNSGTPLKGIKICGVHPFAESLIKAFGGLPERINKESVNEAARNCLKISVTGLNSTPKVVGTKDFAKSIHGLYLKAYAQSNY